MKKTNYVKKVKKIKIKLNELDKMTMCYLKRW